MESRVALVTGITGQDGSYLAELLLGKGYAVHGIVRRKSARSRDLLADLAAKHKASGASRLHLHDSDLSDSITLRRIVTEVEPDELYHLASQSHVGLSFQLPESTCELTGMATLRLLEIARAQAKQPRFFHASSGDVFGQPVETPQTETTPFRPISPYGCAKAFATNIARVYRESYSMFVCNGILYNHESPRRGENFVTRKIARAAARIAKGLEHQLVLGRLATRRDWGRAQDYVRAMWMTLQHPSADDYVVATGQTRSVEDFVEKAFAIVDLPWREYVSYNPAFDRAADPSELAGCAAKINKVLGWHPEGSFDDLVREMVEAELAAIN